MKNIIKIFTLLICVFFLASCGKDSSDNKTSSDSKAVNQGTQVKKAPENMPTNEETGTSIDPSSTANVKFYSASTQTTTVTGVYPNGDKGANFVVAQNDLTKGIDTDRDFGITVDKLLYVKKEPTDKHNPRINEYETGIGSRDVAPEKPVWGFIKAGVDNSGKYYTLQLNQLTFETQGYYKFCVWYMNSNKFFPHEGLKSGYFPKTSEIVR